jgi:hypothetical protein
MKIQTLVADQRGLDLVALAKAIEASYYTPAGKRVRVKIGQGVYIDGTPEGTLRIVDRTDTDVPHPSSMLEARRVTDGAVQ